MIDFNLIPNLEKIQLAKSLIGPVQEYYRDPINVEKFQVWKDNKN